jgi:hypothetical protein
MAGRSCPSGAALACQSLAQRVWMALTTPDLPILPAFDAGTSTWAT